MKRRSRHEYIVTGGTGFLGRRLLERLLTEGRNVTVLGRTPSPELAARRPFYPRALDDADAVRAACAGMETVFHVGAKSGLGTYAVFSAPTS